MAYLMTKRLTSKLMTRWLQTIGRFRRDAGGIAAVEFAMVAPLMLVMLFGMVDVSTGFAIKRKVSMISQSMSDLASRYTTVSETDFTNFFTIGDAMLTPYDKTLLTVRISQLYVDPAAATGKVQWSRGDSQLAAGAIFPVPADLIAKDSNGKIVAGQYLIVSEVNYLFTPIIGYVMPKASVTLTESSYMRPRQSTCVPLSPSTTCTTVVK